MKGPWTVSRRKYLGIVFAERREEESVDRRGGREIDLFV